MPYRDEASILETSLSGTKRHIVAQQIMLHSVITRRQAELKDFMEGMNEFGLLTLLKKNKEIVQPLLFPRTAASVIDKEEVKALIRLEDEDTISVQLVQLLEQYIDLVGSERNGKLL